jgi:CRP-like cAMP-binding protein
MSGPSQSLVANLLLRALSPDDYALIGPHLTPVAFEKGAGLVQPDQPIDRVTFLGSGLSSIIAISNEDSGVEVGLSGRDGLIGLPLLFDCDRTPHRIFMQVEGQGHEMPATAFQDAIDTSASLRKLFLRYAHSFQVQTTYTALSNAVHTIEERLARWLLMSHDRQDSDEIPLTHDFMALMLGVRRPSVTIALHSLEGLAFIKATRGLVTIRSRPDLEEFAGAAYGKPEAEYERLIGPLRVRSSHSR